MNIQQKVFLLSLTFLMGAVTGLQAQNARPWSQNNEAVAGDTVRSIDPYFVPATKTGISPDEEGFIQR